jgi:alanine racemase
MLDVSEINKIEVGTEVILFGTNGKQEINVSEIARKCGKIPYELLCAIGRRVPRIYIKAGEIVRKTNYLD